MTHVWSLDNVQVQRAWLTIGVFDGVHRGHQAIVQKLISGAHAAGSPAVVLTFSPHPAAVLGKRRDPFCLTNPQERADLLLGLGVDLVITQTFDLQLAALSARDFIQRLVGHLGMTRLMVGHDFALGRGREGDLPTLQRLGVEFNYQVELIDPVEINGERVSSSLVRQRLASGDVEQAASLLGRPYRLSGEVVPGDGRGRLLGIPTANLAVAVDRVMPCAGVYACRVGLEGETWGAVTNVGVRPTFEDQPVLPRVETHIMDYSGDLYGENLWVDFVGRLRDEQRFSSIDELVTQIHKDIDRGKEILNR